VKFSGELDSVDDKNDRKKNVVALYSAFAILHRFSLEADMKSFIIPCAFCYFFALTFLLYALQNCVYKFSA
jgi:hypothetical protein